MLSDISDMKQAAIKLHSSLTEEQIVILQDFLTECCIWLTDSGAPNGARIINTLATIIHDTKNWK